MTETHGDIHANHNQQRRGNNGKVAKELENRGWVSGVAAWAHKKRRLQLEM
jgi:hypothetical protein